MKIMNVQKVGTELETKHDGVHKKAGGAKCFVQWEMGLTELLCNWMQKGMNDFCRRFVLQNGML